MPTKAKGKERYGAPKKSEKYLAHLIARCIKAHEPQVKDIDYNRSHFFKNPSANPQLLEPYSEVTYQSNRPDEVHRELKARVTENPPVVEAKAVSGLASDGKAAEAISEALNAAYLLREEQLDQGIQGALFDGQDIDAYGVLRFWRADQRYPGIPEHEFCDELPEDGKAAERYRAVELEDEETEPKAKGRKYMTREKALSDKLQRSRARAGFPYQWDSADRRAVKFLRDSVGLATVVHLQSLLLHDYADTLSGDGLHIDATHDRPLRIYDVEASTSDDPNSSDVWDTNEKLTVATIWTRDAWYEMARKGDASSERQEDWTFVKSGRHGFGRPPFIIVPAQVFDVAEVENRFHAYLQGLFDAKPRMDFMTALMLALAMATAIKLKFLKRDAKSVASLAEDGSPLALVTDASQAQELPPGVDLVTVDDDISGGFVQALSYLREEFDKTTPPLPSQEIGATTQPWTARLQLQVASVLIKQAIKQQAKSLQAMYRAIMRDICTPAEEGGFGQTAYVFRTGEDGREDFDRIIAIDPEQVPSLEFYVTINDVSSAERITMTEHGVNLYERGVITEDDLYNNYVIAPNASKYISQLRGEALFKKQLLPGLMGQAVGQKYGSRFVMGPDGNFLGLGGQVVSPDQALATRGIKAVPGPQPGMSAAMGAPQASMGPLTDGAPPPGVVPQPALVG